MDQNQQGFYRGNDASDFQPTTQNPQSDVSSSLQGASSDLQPVSSSTNNAQQNFPTVEQLEVYGVDSTPGLVQARQSDDEIQTNSFTAFGNFPMLFMAAIFVALVLIAILVKLSSPAALTAGSKAATAKPEPSAVASKKKKNKQSRSKRKNSSAKK